MAVVAAPVKASAESSPWRAQTSGEKEHLHGIFALNGCDVWAVGEETGDNVTIGQAVITATTDGGAHWKSQHFPKGSAVGTTMNRVLFVDKNNGYAVGENNRTANGEAGKPNFLRTSNGGKTWVDQTSNLPAAADGGGAGNLADIEGLSARGRDVWVTVGLYPHSLQGNPGSGLILFSDDRGKTWTVQKSYNLESFDSISMARDGIYGWATSNDAMLWRTTDGGTNWNAVAPTARSGEQVFALSDNHAVIVEDGGNIEYTLDGTTLNAATVPSQVNGSDLTDVSIGDGGVGYATGELSGGLLKTEDAGMTWTWQDSNIAGMNTYNGVTVAHDTKFAWITGEGGLIGANTSALKACHK